MREIKSGDAILRIRASSLTILFYKQAFKTDILKDMSALFQDMVDENGGAQAKALPIPGGLDLLQILWAMHKTQNVAEKLQTPPFEQWIEQNADLVITDVMQDVLEEAMQGFFRAGQQEQADAQRA